MAFDQTKVLASRDIKVFTKAFAPITLLPADTVLWGTAWGTPATQLTAWVESGYTEGGVHFSAEVSRGEIRVDQELDPVLRPATGRNTMMQTNLAEFSAANILAALGQGAITTVAAGSGTKGHDDWDQTSTVLNTYLALGFDILAPGDTEAIRFLGYKGQVLGSPKFDIGAATLVTIPLELALLPDTTTSPARIAKIRDIITALP